MAQTTRLIIDMERNQLRSAARRIKPDKFAAQLSCRPESDLEHVSTVAPGAKILLDTNVLIHLVRGTLPLEVDKLLDTAVIYQCTICKAEICVGLGNSVTTDPRWRDRLDVWIDLFDSVPPNRIVNPDEPVWTEAGLVAGIITRLQHYQPHQMKETLNDAAIYLAAAKLGLTLVTENRTDFDMIQQIAKRGHFAWF